MLTIIAIFLILKAVSNGLKLHQEEKLEEKIMQAILLVIHVYFGIWMLINL
jgi:hypothetical protein